MEAVAKQKSIPMSARKMRLVVDNIRGKAVNEALNILEFSKQEAAIWLKKTLLSAIANWQYKTGESAADFDLYVKTVFSDQGTQLKRYRPAPHGRPHRIRKHSNHITIVVENRVALESEAEVEAEVTEE